LISKLATIEKQISKQSNINGLVVEHVIRQALSSKYPIIVYNAPAVVDLLRSFGIPIATTYVSFNLRDLISGFIDDVAVLSNNFPFLNKHKIGKSEEIEFDEMRVENIQNILTLVITTEIKTSFKYYSIIQLMRQMYIVGRILQDSFRGKLTANKFRLKGSAIFATIDNEQPEVANKIKMEFHEGTIPATIYLIPATAQIKSTVSKTVINTPNAMNPNRYILEPPKPNKFLMFTKPKIPVIKNTRKRDEIEINQTGSPKKVKQDIPDPIN